MALNWFIHRYLKEPIVLAYWYMDDGALKWKNHSNGVKRSLYEKK